MEANTSNQAIVAIQPQYYIVNRCKQLYPVKSYAKTLSTTKCNWPIYDKEPFTIVDCFGKWRNWLAGIKVNTYTAYQGLQWLKRTQNLKFQQASWYLCISEIIYHIYYGHECNMSKPDGLSRRLGEERNLA